MATNDLLTATEAYRALNITNAADQTRVATHLAEVITEASMFIDDLCGPVVKRDVTEIFRQPYGSVALRVPPGSSTFTVTFATVTEYASGTATVLTAEDADTAGTYRYDPRTGALLRRSSWMTSAWYAHELVVVYNGGRFADTAAVDQKFKGACRKVLMHKWQNRGSQSGFGTPGGDGAPFGGIPYSPKTLLEHLQVDLRGELLLHAAGLTIA